MTKRSFSDFVIFLETDVFSFASSADASLPSPSRICARVQAANPKVSAGSSSALIKHDDSGVGLIPISAQTRAINGKSVFRRSQARTCMMQKKEERREDDFVPVRHGARAISWDAHLRTHTWDTHDD